MRLLRLKSILVATDLDEASRPALRTAAKLAPLAGARLHLLHVGRETEAQLTRHFHEVVGEAAEPATVRSVGGSPADEIVAHARSVGADAIILGPHRGNGGTAPLGSTAAEVVANAPCPCLVAAADLTLPLKNVLAPIDLSEIAPGTLSVALTWTSALRTRDGNTQLTALYIVGATPDAMMEEQLQQEIERARADAGTAAHVLVRGEIGVVPDPVAGVLRFAKEEHADMVVLGTHGAADAGTELGSVTAAVVRANPCPLLLVPPSLWQVRSDSEAR